jgi:hypothetical protein
MGDAVGQGDAFEQVVFEEAALRQLGYGVGNVDMGLQP